jgi:hypothetical protein
MEWSEKFIIEIPKVEDFENKITDYLTFKYKMIMQGKDYLFENT